MYALEDSPVVREIGTIRYRKMLRKGRREYLRLLKKEKRARARKHLKRKEHHETV